MTSVPKRLTTRHLYSEDPAKAAEEALLNAHRLVQAGHAEVAFKVFSAMLEPGPWRTSRGFHLRYWVLSRMLRLAQRLGKPAPALDADDEIGAMALRASRQDQGEFAVQLAEKVSFSSQGSSSKDWTGEELGAVLSAVRAGDYGEPLRELLSAARLELQHRLGARLLGRRSPGDSGSHGAIADAVERGVGLAFPRDVAEAAVDVALPAAALDILEGNEAAAAQRLGRMLPSLPLLRKSDEPYWAIDAYARFLERGWLSDAFGIDAAGADAYLAAFQSRSPYTIVRPKPRPWKKVLNEWVSQQRELGMDAESLEYTVSNGAPTSKALGRRAKNGNPLNVAAPEAAVLALESRLGASLPPSYREFLLASNGLILPNFLALLPAEEVDWLSTLGPEVAAGWSTNAGDEASDEEYAVYGAEQDCIHMRPAHLHTALQISTECDADILLLIPAVRFGEEWEAWFLGAKNPGAYRYKSFRDMMEQRLLVDDCA